MANGIFTGIAAPCCSGDSNEDCVCGPEERVLRAYARGDITTPMSAEQRQWCLDRAAHAGEGAYPRSCGEKMDDQALAQWVLSAWRDYVKSQGLM